MLNATAGLTPPPNPLPKGRTPWTRWSRYRNNALAREKPSTLAAYPNQVCSDRGVDPAQPVDQRLDPQVLPLCAGVGGVHPCHVVAEWNVCQCEDRDHQGDLQSRSNSRIHLIFRTSPDRVAPSADTPPVRPRSPRARCSRSRPTSPLLTSGMQRAQDQHAQSEPCQEQHHERGVGHLVFPCRRR